MDKPAFLYTQTNTSVAYQLNWSLSLFLSQQLPRQAHRLDELNATTENDGVRILEWRFSNDRTVQFFLSTQPHVSPTEVVRSVKGRWQHLIRDVSPKAFQRNYGIYGVGEANNKCLSGYLAKQTARHRMADPCVQERIERLQFHDTRIDLTTVRYTSHGQYNHSLQIVFENLDHLHDVSSESLLKIRSAIIRYCEQKQLCLARIGLLTNHVHILVGCDATESPQAIALALMNHISLAFGMKVLFEYGYYVGTFGVYDRGAMRKYID